MEAQSGEKTGWRKEERVEDREERETKEIEGKKGERRQMST